MNGVAAAIVPLPTMEANKDFELVFELARQMEHFKLNRRVAAHWLWFYIVFVIAIFLLWDQIISQPIFWSVL